MTRRRGGAVSVVLLALALAVPAARSETPVPVKADAETADLSGPTILVRTGEHPGYTRIVFDWREAVDYRLDREDGHIRVVFNRKANFDLSRLPPQPGRWIETIVTAGTAEGALVRLGVDEDARLRHLRVGPKVVVDVFATQRSRGRPRERTPSPAPVTAPVETAEPAASADPAKDQSVALETAALADGDAPAAEPDAVPADATAASAGTAAPIRARDSATASCSAGRAPRRRGRAARCRCR